MYSQGFGHFPQTALPLTHGGRCGSLSRSTLPHRLTDILQIRRSYLRLSWCVTAVWNKVCQGNSHISVLGKQLSWRVLNRLHYSAIVPSSCRGTVCLAVVVLNCGHVSFHKKLRNEKITHIFKQQCLTSPICWKGKWPVMRFGSSRTSNHRQNSVVSNATFRIFVGAGGGGGAAKLMSSHNVLVS
jgi:hypothetical protein